MDVIWVLAHDGLGPGWDNVMVAMDALGKG